MLWQSCGMTHLHGRYGWRVPQAILLQRQQLVGCNARLRPAQLLHVGRGAGFNERNRSDDKLVCRRRFCVAVRV